MRAFSRFFSSRIFIILGTASLLVLLVVAITGGFTIRAGPLRVSAHNWIAALVATAAVWALAVRVARATLAEDLAVIWPFVEAHAAALAVILAASAAGAGIAHGTFTAAGSDAAGYVSEADLMAHGALSRDEPLARYVGWPESALAFTTLGYKSGADTGILVPTYPPGLPAMMALGQRVAGEFGPYFVPPLLGALAVWCTYLLGARLHSRVAGVIAAALQTTSPIFLFNVSQPMSDVPAAALWAAALLIATTARRFSPFVAGLVAGAAVLIRPNLIPLAGAVAFTLVVLRSGPRSARRHVAALTWFAAGVAPLVIALLLVQRHLYGTLVASGHGPVDEFFAVANVLPNLRDYTQRMLTGEAAAIALLAASTIAIAIRRRGRRTAANARDERPTLRPALLLAGVVMTTVLACYLPYGVFADWYYLRFLLPAFPALFVAVGACAADALSSTRPAARGLALVAVLAAACSVNVVLARIPGAFRVRFTQERAQLTGRYLDSMLPLSAVIITGEQSASAYHYTHRPVMRWDLTHVDLDAAIATLRALGRDPVIVAEEWEVPQIRAQFPASVYARLDWQPRATIAEHVLVYVYDPRDRGRTAYANDRVR